MKGCRPLTTQEVEVALNGFSGRYAKRNRALFLLGIKSGFRISELLSLRLKDFVQNGEMVKRISVQRGNMKKKIEGRTVLLHPEAGAALAEWVEELGRRNFPQRGYIFASQKNPHRPIDRKQA